MDQTLVNSTKSMVKNLLTLSKKGKSKLWVDYDKEGDVLYVNFDRPQKADHAYQDEGIIKRIRKNELVGITILNASRLVAPH